MLTSVNDTDASAVKLVAEKDLLQVEWGDGYRSKFHYLWLRDNSPSISQVNGMSTIDPLSIPAEPYPQKVHLNQIGEIEIIWANDGHISKFKPAWLRRNDYHNGRQQKWQPKLWGSEKINSITKADYKEILQDQAKLKDWLLSLNDDGIAVLENVPTEPDTILEVASQFGCLQETPWGKLCNIKTVENPNTTAFTNTEIFLHNDLVHLPISPAYMMLHYLKTTTIGGENTLVDGFQIAEALRQEAPEKFELLSTFPMEFRFQYPHAELVGKGEIIHLDYLGKVKSIRFSSRSIQPFKLPSKIMKPYYEAYRTFAEMCNSNEYQIRLKFNSGDFVILDNHRVLHGRTEYTGERWVQCAYLSLVYLRDEL